MRRGQMQKEDTIVVLDLSYLGKSQRCLSACVKQRGCSVEDVRGDTLTAHGV